MVSTMSPSAMTADQRRRQLAVILARGVLRLRKRVRSAAGSVSRKSPESIPNRP